jgi:hypothetical protein
LTFAGQIDDVGRPYTRVGRTELDAGIANDCVASYGGVASIGTNEDTLSVASDAVSFDQVPRTRPDDANSEIVWGICVTVCMRVV